MGRYDDEFDDPDAPLDQDIDDDSGFLPEMACPNCGASVTEDTQKCPHCGDWITAMTPSRQGGRKRVILIVAVVLMLLAMLRFIL